MTERVSNGSKTLLYWGLGFAALFAGLAVFSQPRFPAYTPYGIPVSYWLPLAGILPVFFLLYKGRRLWAGIWLLSFFPAGLLLNLNLLRPDVYFLFLCLLLLCVAGTGRFPFGLRLLMAGMYVWTGIHKINPAFMEQLPAFLQKRLFHHSVPDEWLSVAAQVFPFAEIVLGILCLLPFSRLRSVFGILLHIGILATLLGGWNRSMIPWNLLLIACHVYLWKDVSWYGRASLKAVGIPAALSLLFPALFLVNAWPVFGSWAMYSARLEPYYLPVTEAEALRTPAYVEPYLYTRKGGYYIGLAQWADAETGGAACPEPVFKELVFEQSLEYIAENP